MLVVVLGKPLKLCSFIVALLSTKKYLIEKTINLKKQNEEHKTKVQKLNEIMNISQE